MSDTKTEGRRYFTSDECSAAMDHAIAENGGRVYNGCMGAGLRMLHGDIGHEPGVGFYLRVPEPRRVPTHMIAPKYLADDTPGRYKAPA